MRRRGEEGAGPGGAGWEFSEFQGGGLLLTAPREAVSHQPLKWPFWHVSGSPDCSPWTRKRNSEQEDGLGPAVAAVLCLRLALFRS